MCRWEQLCAWPPSGSSGCLLLWCGLKNSSVPAVGTCCVCSATVPGIEMSVCVCECERVCVCVWQCVCVCIYAPAHHKHAFVPENTHNHSGA